MPDDLSWFAGVDWASAHHRACLLGGDGTRIAERNFTHAGAGLTELCDWLLTKTGAPAAAIAVAIETPRGPVVEALLERRFAVFSINPKQLDRFRDRFTVAGAKDDSRDAEVLASSLRTDRRAFRRLTVDDPLVIELREWTRIHDELTQERSRLANRVRDQLWRYYPQARDLSDDLAADWFLDLWQQVPTPAQAARTSEKTVARILKQHRIRRLDAGTVLRVLRAQALTVAPGTGEAASAHIRTLAARARLINAQLKEAQRRLDELCGVIEAAAEASPGQICEQRDVVILRSFPGLGRITLATLLAEACEPLRRRDYHALRCLSGAAPVTRRSGKACFVVRRHACNKRLAQAIFHWARCAKQHDPITAKRYAELRRRGHSHARALRSVADRLLCVLCTLLERQVLFDRNFQASLVAQAA
jgi:transposase